MTGKQAAEFQVMFRRLLSRWPDAMRNPGYHAPSANWTHPTALFAAFSAVHALEAEGGFHVERENDSWFIIGSDGSQYHTISCYWDGDIGEEVLAIARAVCSALDTEEEISGSLERGAHDKLG